MNAADARRIHLIGIGGAGMSALAQLLHARGWQISGSDREQSPMTELLASQGIAIQIGHKPDWVTRADIVVYSSAVGESNPERRWAGEHGVVQVRRAVLLGDVMKRSYSIGVSGTHGKTTTTALIGHLLSEAGMDPSVLVGGLIREKGTNARIGESNVMIVEADEYDRSFLALHPDAAIVTNIDADHLDCYQDIDEIAQAFAQYVRALPFDGVLVACTDDERVRDVCTATRCRVVTCGLGNGVRYRADGCRSSGGGTDFDVSVDNRYVATVHLPLPGRHNVLNALAALTMACEHGVDPARAAGFLGTFGGVRRRFETAGCAAGVTVVDDYAHHPAEIAATLQAAATMGYRRIVAVFQPHLYTRTRDHLDAFARALAPADVVFVAPIYRSREEIIEGVRSQGIVDRLVAGGHGSATGIDDLEGAVDGVVAMLQEGDGVIVMGAGDIWMLCARILERLQ